MALLIYIVRIFDIQVIDILSIAYVWGILLFLKILIL